MWSDSDWHLLDAYLDDALSPTEVQRLDARFSDEPALADAFDTLKAARAARIATFAAGAPDQAGADRVADNILASIHRKQRSRWLVRHLRIVGAVAACLVVGFAVGWVGRGRAPTHTVAIDIPAYESPAIVTAKLPARANPDAHLAIHSPKTPEPGQYQVAIFDGDGKVIALQRFTKLEDARQFTDDLAQFEARRQQVQDSQPMLVSDSF